MIDWDRVAELSAEWRSFDGRRLSAESCCQWCTTKCLHFTDMQAVGRSPSSVKSRYQLRPGILTAQPAADPAAPLLAKPTAQLPLDFGQALLAEQVCVAAHSAAGDPRLAGSRSVLVRVVVADEAGRVHLTYSRGGVQHAFPFHQFITRSLD